MNTWLKSVNKICLYMIYDMSVTTVHLLCVVDLHRNLVIMSMHFTDTHKPLGFQNTEGLVLIPLLSTKSNLKVATKNMNIIRAVLKNTIDLSVVV